MNASANARGNASPKRCRMIRPFSLGLFITMTKKKLPHRRLKRALGSAVPGYPHLRGVSLYVDDVTFGEVSVRAYRRRTSISQVCREYIEWGLENDADQRRAA